MSGYRLPASPSTGAAIDRERPIAFTWNGVPLHGFAGDTLASALLANGVSVVARSFKYHRPRGIVTAGHDEPNAFVRIVAPHALPSAAATTTALIEGLTATSLNAWPSLRFDVGAIADRLHRFLPPGFYYKTFMSPGWSWYERAIRRAAGIAQVPITQVPIARGSVRSERRYAFCDVLVIGAGAAGREAASAAAADGKRTILLGRGAIEPIESVRTLARTTALGYYDHDLVVALESVAPDFERLWKIRTREIVVATGAAERPLVFAGNDTPGVMLLSAAVAYATRHAVAVGKRCVIVTNHSAAYQRAQALANAGVAIGAIIDLRPKIDGAEAELARTIGASVLLSETILAVHGRDRVSGLTVAPSANLDASRTLECDTVLMAGGWVSRRGAFSNAHAVGAAAAINPVLGDTLIELPGSSGRRAFVDFQNDVTSDDLRAAVGEGYASIEHVKRYTTSGMGIDQGKLVNANAAAIVAAAHKHPPAEVSTSRFRPPYLPTAFGAIAALDAGERLRPIRETPMSTWHRTAGAVMYESGAGWQRPGYYPKANESMAAAMFRECRATRESVAIYDGTPLGRFEIRGAEAGWLLERVYAGRIANMTIGRGRYGLMLREDGRLLDDGVVFRLADDHFWITATSGNTETVHAWLEYCRQVLFPSRAVVVPVQGQWANAVVCGPRARDLLAAVGTDIDLHREAFPFMSMREGHVAGLPARVFRVSFTGELSYEINVASTDGLTLWTRLIEAGEAFGLTPIGSEANHALRIEKGYISIGHEADGMATPFDLTLDRFVAMEKPDFVGKRALEEDVLDRAAPRRELVGLLTNDPNIVLPEGAQVLAAAGDRDAIGFVTASVMSATLRRSIALALVESGRDRQETDVHVTLGAGSSSDAPGARASARVTPAMFFDPTGARLRG